MYQRSTVTMSMRELDRIKVIQAVLGGELRAGLAAERLGVSARQVRRLAERYRGGGPIGLTSRRRNRPRNRRAREEPPALDARQTRTWRHPVHSSEGPPRNFRVSEAHRSVAGWRLRSPVPR